jgi:RNA polymerase-binding transcription factor DksA
MIHSNQKEASDMYHQILVPLDGSERAEKTFDAAQKEDLARLIHKLMDRGQEEIEEINLALDKIKSGRYGRCELCGKPIPLNRLRVVPATRFCRKCAQKYERNQKMRQHLPDEIIDEKLLDEYRSLNDETESIGLVKLPAEFFNSV